MFSILSVIKHECLQVLGSSVLHYTVSIDSITGRMQFILSSVAFL